MTTISQVASGQAYINTTPPNTVTCPITTVAVGDCVIFYYMMPTKTSNTYITGLSCPNIGNWQQIGHDTVSPLIGFMGMWVGTVTAVGACVITTSWSGTPPSTYGGYYASELNTQGGSNFGAGPYADTGGTLLPSNTSGSMPALTLPSLSAGYEYFYVGGVNYDPTNVAGCVSKQFRTWISGIGQPIYSDAYFSSSSISPGTFAPAYTSSTGSAAYAMSGAVAFLPGGAQIVMVI